MQIRVAIVAVAFLAGLPLVTWILGPLSNEAEVVLALVWFLLFAVGQFWLFRCPHCGKLAVIRPSGVATPFVGSTCAYCHREY